MDMPMEILVGKRRLSAAAAPGQTVLEALAAAGVREVETPCGGRGRCGKCLVTVTGPVTDAGTGKTRTAENERVLACRTVPAGRLRVTVGESAGPAVVRGAVPIPGGGEGLGLAVDIGTTTVAALLYDLGTGLPLGTAGGRNAQRVFGADVISRITACGEGNLPALRDAVRSQITRMGLELLAAAGRDAPALRRVTLAGNTVMEHLAAGLDPTSIGTAPFTPVSLFGESLPAAALLPAFDGAELYICPCLSGYVGGDVTAGLMAAGADEARELTLYLDIGTNGEMALGDADGYLTCAAAAGPAFEGAEIACGMDGSAGAVDRVEACDGEPAVHVIGGGEAKGLCGSGLIDAAAVLLDLGVIDETGRMLGPEELPPPLAARSFVLPDGMRAFRLAGGVYLSARDVRQVQLAKAAIRAGAEALLDAAGKTAADIGALVIAGGFGSFLDKASALRIGLLPAVEPGRIRHAGNAAGAGAALALTPEGRTRLRALTDRCSYLELSSSRAFMDSYIDRMFFEEEEP